MVRAFRPDAHALQRQAGLPADILPLVCRGNVHVTGTVIGNFGGLAVLVQPEQIEFHLCSEGKGQSGLFGVLYRFFQQAPGVRADDGAVWLGHGAEHPHHPSMLRPPGQHTEGGRVRAQQQIRVDLPAEAGNGGAVDGDTVLEGPVQFLRHNGDIFLAARRVAEGHANELHVLLRRILLDLLNRILHIVSAFPLWFPYACPAIQAPSFFDATVIAHLFMNLQYVKQKKSWFSGTYSPSCSHIGGYRCRSGHLSCFALCGDPFQTACPFRPCCNKKGVHFQREPMLPLKMNAFAHFVFKKTDSTNQHRSYHVRPRLSIIFLSNTVQKGGPSPSLLSLTGAYTVPVTISSLTPGVTAHAPVTGSWVYVAAGTVICPAVVANRPVVPS